jgi:SAM-dependent methyltransferase
MEKSLNIQFGCGLCAPDEWVNFDSSPTLKLQRLLVAGMFFKGGGFPKFPSNVRCGDIVKGLPFASGTADRLYCSHVLEHLALADFRKAITETHRLLKPGGVFRLVLPDLEIFAKEYLESKRPERAIVFMEQTILGVKARNRGIMRFLRDWLGGSKHLWMWDYEGMKCELERAGLKDIRRAKFGDSVDSAFALVEDSGRWTNALGVECRR